MRFIISHANKNKKYKKIKIILSIKKQDYIKHALIKAIN